MLVNLETPSPAIGAEIVTRPLFFRTLELECWLEVAVTPHRALYIIVYHILCIKHQGFKLSIRKCFMEGVQLCGCQTDGSNWAGMGGPAAAVI